MWPNIWREQVKKASCHLYVFPFIMTANHQGEGHQLCEIIRVHVSLAGNALLVGPLPWGGKGLGGSSPKVQLKQHGVPRSHGNPLKSCLPQARAWGPWAGVGGSRGSERSAVGAPPLPAGGGGPGRRAAGACERPAPAFLSDRRGQGSSCAMESGALRLCHGPWTRGN